MLGTPFHVVKVKFPRLPLSTQSTKKSFGGSSTQTHTWGGGGSCGHLRGHQPAQPFIQDPAMPPLPPPNTLAQLEEACRRLEEVSTKPTKQRYTQTSKSRLLLSNALGYNFKLFQMCFLNSSLISFLFPGIQRPAFSERRPTSCLFRTGRLSPCRSSVPAPLASLRPVSNQKSTMPLQSCPSSPLLLSALLPPPPLSSSLQLPSVL